MNKVIEVQKEIRENAAEMQDFLKDLDSWAKEMQAKDQQLKEAKVKKQNDNGLEKKTPYAATNKISMNHTKNKSSGPRSKSDASAPSPPKKEKINAFDYDKWDKFDVDAECEKIDQGEGSESEEDDSSEEEELENERLRQQAVAEKERGNQLFKAGKFEQAIEKYTKGIQCDPLCPILPANRAMAFLKTGQLGAAERDATLSLSLDNTYVKAYQRRATARVGLNKLEAAKKDFEKILELEPSNKLARAELDKLHEKLNKPELESQTGGQNEVKEGKQPPPASSVKANLKGIFDKSNAQNKSDSTVKADPYEVKPIVKPPHLRSKTPLKRIAIQDGVTMSSKASTSSASPEKISFKNETKAVLISEVKSDDSTRPNNLLEIASKDEEPEKALSTPPKQPKTKRIQIIEVDSGETKETALQSIEVAEAASTSPAAKETDLSRSRGLALKVEKEMMEEIKSKDNKDLDGAADQVGAVAPTTFGQFVKDWRRISDNKARLSYLLLLNQDTYKAVFKSNMESKQLVEIIHVLYAAVQSGTDITQEQAKEQILGISGLPRISALCMFLSKQEQTKLGAVVTFADLPTESRTKINNILSL